LNQRDRAARWAAKLLETPPPRAKMGFANKNTLALGGAFRVKINFKRELRRTKQRIEHRLRDRVRSPQDKPMLTARNIHYEMSSRDRAITAGGIGAMQQLVQKLDLAARRRRPARVALLTTPLRSRGTDAAAHHNRPARRPTPTT
jgi:hypothetical protein